MDDKAEAHNVLLISMIVFLVLLSIVIWVSFCAALRKMARLLIEMKEQRRRQAIIAAAISRAANEPATRLNMLIQEQQAAIEEVIQTQESELPSYEEAIHMNNYPNAPRIPPTIHPRDNYI